MTRLYLSGRMSGVEDHNFPAFANARERLRGAGYEVVCPAELGQVRDWTWVDYLKRDIAHLVTCEAVAVLDGWSQSRGAKLEVALADRLDMDVMYVDEWIWLAQDKN